MKQVLLFCILSALLSGLCACGGTPSASPSSSATPSAQQSTAAEKPKSSFKGSLTEFSTVDLAGETVTQDTFAQNDLTMVNLWTTWCGFCIDEMPELQQLYNELPEGVGMITICCDADTEAELAGQIMSDNGCTFAALLPNDAIQTSLLNYVEGFPTTVFVDSHGNPVGDAQVGVPSLSDAKGGYLSLIDARLKEVTG